MLLPLILTLIICTVVYICSRKDIGRAITLSVLTIVIVNIGIIVLCGLIIPTEYYADREHLQYITSITDNRIKVIQETDGEEHIYIPSNINNIVVIPDSVPESVIVVAYENTINHDFMNAWLINPFEFVKSRTAYLHKDNADEYLLKYKDKLKEK